MPSCLRPRRGPFAALVTLVALLAGTACAHGATVTSFSPASSLSPALSPIGPGGNQIPGVDKVFPRFDSRIVYRTTGSRSHLKLISVLVSPAVRFGLSSFYCDTCDPQGPYFLTTRRGSAHLTFKHSLTITKSTHLVVTDAGLAGIGRYKLYGVNPAAGRVTVIASGCIAPDSWSDFFPGFDTKFTRAQLRHEPTVPCAGEVPDSDKLAITGPGQVTAGQPATATLTGSAPTARWLTLREAPNNDTFCPAVPADGGYPPYAPEPTAIASVSGNFSVNLSLTTYATPQVSKLCAYLQTGGRFDGLPDGRRSAFTSTGLTLR